MKPDLTEWWYWKQHRYLVYQPRTWTVCSSENKCVPRPGIFSVQVLQKFLTDALNWTWNSTIAGIFHSRGKWMIRYVSLTRAMNLQVTVLLRLLLRGKSISDWLVNRSTFTIVVYEKFFKGQSEFSVQSTTKKLCGQPLWHYLRISQKWVLFLHGVFHSNISIATKWITVQGVRGQWLFLKQFHFYQWELLIFKQLRNCCFNQRCNVTAEIIIYQR